MHKINKILIIIAIYITIFLTPISAVFAKTVSVDVLLLNIRSGPATDYPIIGSLEKFSERTVLEETNDWYKIKTDDNNDGWIAAWLTSPVDLKDINISTTEKPDQSNQSIDNNNKDLVEDKQSTGHNNKFEDNSQVNTEIVTTYAEANVYSLNIRTEASLTSAVISSIQAGQKYELIKKETDWSLIQLDSGSEGWAYNKFLNFSQEETLIPDKNTNPNNNDFLDNNNKSVLITAEVLNVRLEADINSEIISKLYIGDTVLIYEVKNGWYRIDYQGSPAWISASYVDEISNTPAEENESEESDGNSSNISDKPMVIIPIDGINIRQGADTNFPVVEKAQKGDRFEIINSHNDWYEIIISKGNKAYVASWVVEVENIDSSNIDNKYNGLLKGKTIVIDPGHGGIDGGAIGTSFKTLEKDIILSTSLLLKQKLKAAGANVIMTRETDVFLGLAQRVDISNKHQADAFVSIHYNTNPNKLMNGTIVYYYNANANDAKLANHIQAGIIDKTGLNNLGARYGNYYVLRENKQVAVLVETAFISNYDNELLSRSKQFQDKVAEGILKGLTTYFTE